MLWHVDPEIDWKLWEHERRVEDMRRYHEALAGLKTRQAGGHASRHLHRFWKRLYARLVFAYGHTRVVQEEGV